MLKIYDLAVIGAGPGGISATVEARAAGIENILLIEKGENSSQTIRKFYKEHKRVDKDYKGIVVELEGTVHFDDGTRETTLDMFDDILDHDYIDALFKCEVEKVKKNEDNTFTIVTATAEYIAKNVVIAIGKMGKPNKPDYKIPPKVKKIVNFNLDNCSSDENVLVVGGGNSAAEYVVHLCKENKVTLNYRRDRFTRLNDINEKDIYDAEKEGKIKFKIGVDIEGLEEEDGKVKVLYTDGDSAVYDRVIYAIGGTTPVEFLKSCGIEFEGKHPMCDENYETNVKGLYVAGDIAADKGGSIALALNHSYKIVENILKNS